jgi:hypothetical protein
MKGSTASGRRPQVQGVAPWNWPVVAALGHASRRVPQRTIKYNGQDTAEL